MGQHVSIVKSDWAFQCLCRLIVSAVAKRSHADVVPALGLGRRHMRRRTQQTKYDHAGDQQNSYSDQDVRDWNPGPLQDLRKVAQRSAMLSKRRRNAALNQSLACGFIQLLFRSEEHT